MTINYWLYNTQNDIDHENVLALDNPVDAVLPIDKTTNIINKLAALFPSLGKWEAAKNKLKPYIIIYTSSGNNNCTEEEYLDLSLIENDENKMVYFIVANSASSRLLSIIKKEFSLKYVFDPQAWESIEID
jgi:hypothetical protein